MSEFIEDIKKLLKDEKGNELFPVVESFCDGESSYFQSAISLEDMCKLQEILGDGFFDLTSEYPLKIKLLTKEENFEANYNGAIFGNGSSSKIAFMEAHDLDISDEEYNAENDEEETLSYSEAKVKFSYLLN